MKDPEKIHESIEPSLKLAHTAESEELRVIEAVQNGEKDEYHHLVSRYQNMIFAMVLRQVGERSTAEEISQEVFVKAYLNINKFEKRSRFSTWLTRIALNQTSTYFTSKSTRLQKINDSFDDHMHEVSDKEKQEDLEHKKDQQRLLKAFHEALKYLKPIYREVLVICGLEGKTYEEAASLLGIPIGTVRSRLNKARLLMKEKVEELGV